MDGGVWWATVLGVAKSRTCDQFDQFSVTVVFSLSAINLSANDVIATSNGMDLPEVPFGEW